MTVDGAIIPISRVPRQPGQTSPGSSTYVALSDSNEFAYLVDVSIGGQSFQVVFDTGSADLWVASSECTSQDCANITKYNITDSSTSSLTDSEFHLRYLIGSVTGQIATDTVTLGPYEIFPQVFALANNTAGLDLQGTGYSGILGLAFPVEASIPETVGRTLGENVFAAMNESDRFFAFKLGRNETGSSFTIGKLDPAFANSTSNLAYTPVSAAGGGYNYWKLPLQSLTINSTTFDLSTTHVKDASTNIAVLDTGTTLILGPSREVARFWDSVGGARQTDAGWQVRCNRAVIVGFVLGDNDSQKEYVIDPVDVAWEEGGRQDDWCMGGIQANDGVFSGDWLLGDTFLRNVYVAQHVGNSSQPPSIGLLGMTDPISALAQFRQTRGDDALPPAQVRTRAPHTDTLTGADVCGIAVSSGFVFGVLVVILWHALVECRDRKRRMY